MRSSLVAGWVAVSGTSAHALASIGALAATGASNASAGDIISTTGSVSAAGALIYIVKKMTDGQLVARDPARVESQIAAIAEAQARLIEDVAADHARLAAEGMKREDRLHQVIGAFIKMQEDEAK